MLYRFRAIDRLPEPSSTAQVRGSVVHAALEQLYALPAAERGPDTAMTLVDPAWERVVAEQPELADDFEPELRAELLERGHAHCCRATTAWRTRPGSTRRAASSASRWSSTDGTLLRGFVDRIDVAPTGELRVVDYKTGKAPPEARALAEFKAMFQMKFYAVALLRSRGVLPARLRLLYLADGQVLDYTPDLDELLRFEKTLMAIWRAIQSAGATGDFRPNPSRHVRLVRPPRALPGVRRHSSAVPGLADSSRRRSTPRRRRCAPRSLLRDRLPITGEPGHRQATFQVFESTDGTRSNWDPEIQHGSPPLALMTKLIEEAAADSGLRIGRLTLDILGAIPVAPRAGAGLGATAGHPDLAVCGRDVGARCGRHRACGRASHGVAVGHQRHRRCGHRSLSRR